MHKEQAFTKWLNNIYVIKDFLKHSEIAGSYDSEAVNHGLLGCDAM
jgi:hypothetical protein